MRYRRLKAAYLESAKCDGLSKVLMHNSSLDRPARDALVGFWAAGIPASNARVQRVLTDAGLTMDAVMAQTLVQKLDMIERLEHLTALAETRRGSMLREIDQHRSTLARSLRKVTERIEDAEFEELTPDLEAPK